jgi:hypothetical protein
MITKPVVPAPPPSPFEVPDLPELRRLLDAATEGPWFVDQGGEFNDPFWQIGAVLRDRYGANSISSSDRPTIELIVALHNAAEWLLAQAAAVARVEALLSLVGRIQAPDPDTGDRLVSFFAIAEALHPDDEDDAALAGPGVSE